MLSALADPEGLRCVGRLRQDDVLIGFDAVQQEVTIKLGRLASKIPTQGEVCELADRLKEQRELVRQLSLLGGGCHIRRLIRMICHSKKKLLHLVQIAGLDPQPLSFR